MAERRPWAGAISSPDDVRRVLDAVNRDGLTRANTTALAEVIRPAEQTEVGPDASKLLPAPPGLAPLLPWPGLRRGATIAVTGSASVLMQLLAAGMRDGGWAAVVGCPTFGVLAAAEAGVPVDRLALIHDPGPDWPTVVAALLDGVDLVVVGNTGPVAEKTIRGLQARARQRGAVLLSFAPTSQPTWPGCDVAMSVTSRRWAGLERGRGRLKRQTLDLAATGRGKAARGSKATITVGVPVTPLVIPPPPAGQHAEPTTRESPLWRTVEPNNPPADAWADLQPPALAARKRKV
ncbi:hypothetical protein Ade02nite_20700 [Paractinoplanes deccanensis]|uniref:Recombinase A n=1 Tax=Paractinoplanes deccanensis TaxID=113561 RepID=A0ABQ3Y0A1_9ACTN|nr:hypothetical protein [Actinoplanes deccanensis]GID73429.1 hypothetical protein Ade02nite_20700 [Actinoplanes deccanensis]